MVEITQPENLVIPTDVVELPDGSGSLVVRGLGLSDILHIYRTHSEEIELLWETAKLLPPADNTVDLAMDVLVNASAVAMEVIACSIGGKQHLALANELPLSMQLTILLACFNLTVEKEGGLGKLAASVSGIIRQISRAKALLQQSNG